MKSSPSALLSSYPLNISSHKQVLLGGILCCPVITLYTSKEQQSYHLLPVSYRSLLEETVASGTLL